MEAALASSVLISHSLGVVNLVLITSAIILIIYISRKHVLPIEGSYMVESEYTEPCNALFHFSNSWRNRWSSKRPQYHVIVYFTYRMHYH